MSNIVEKADKEELKQWVLLRNQIIVEIIDGRTQSKFGLDMVVTDNNPLIPDRGIVINIDSGCETKVKIGDKIIFDRYQGQKYVDSDGNAFIMLKENHVLAILPASADVTIRQGQLR